MAHKSVLVSMQITTALRGHSCRFNDTHKIVKGANRLTIKEDGNQMHYCLACAQTILAKGLDRLAALQGSVDRLLAERMTAPPEAATTRRASRRATQ